MLELEARSHFAICGGGWTVDWVCCIWDLPGEGGAERGERRGAAAGGGEEGRGGEPLNLGGMTHSHPHRLMALLALLD